jgi:outer membrane usher protein
MEGSVTLMERRLHFNRRVNESFGAISVGGIEGVRVYARNQLIGRTDANGYLFIPSLLPYQRNKISIDPRDIPLAYQPGKTEVYLTPYRHSGIGYTFAVTKTVSAIMHLYTTSGKPVGTGARWTLDGKTAGIVGTKGLLYLETLGEGAHTLRIREESESCAVTFHFDEAAAARFLTDLGDFSCKETE